MYVMAQMNSGRIGMRCQSQSLSIAAYALSIVIGTLSYLASLGALQTNQQDCRILPFGDVPDISMGAYDKLAHSRSASNPCSYLATTPNLHNTISVRR